MFAANVDYYRAGSVAEAISLLGEHDGARLLAGGHSLIPLMKLRLASPSALIDIGGIDELRSITSNGAGLSVGSMATYYEISQSAAVQSVAPALAEAAGQVADVQVRNRGTIGGSLAHSDPAGDLPAVFLALGGTSWRRPAEGLGR